MRELIDRVIVWAKDRGIFEKGTPLAQMEKTEEEVAELRAAIEQNDKAEVIDAIGDIIVTLIIQAEMQGVDIEPCLREAYEIINQRTGKMVDGKFVKDK